MTPQMIADARDWLADCAWLDMESDDFADITDSAVIDGVRRHYDGGINQFISTNEES
jgi:hypothetical protein